MVKTVYAKPYQPSLDYAELAKWRRAWNQGEQGHFTRKMIQQAERQLLEHGFDPNNPPQGLVIEGVGGVACPHCGKHIDAVMPELGAKVSEPTGYVGGDAVRIQQDADQQKFAEALRKGEVRVSGDPAEEGPEQPLLAPTGEDRSGANLSTDEQLAPEDPILREVWERKPRPVQGPKDTTTPDDAPKAKAKKK